MLSKFTQGSHLGYLRVSSLQEKLNYLPHVPGFLNFVPKCIVGHLKEFCKYMGTGLLPYNEQAFESMHAKFAMYANGRLPKNPDHPSYGAALLNVVKELNVRHSN